MLSESICIYLSFCIDGKASRRLSFPHQNERLQLRLEAESAAFKLAAFKTYKYLLFWIDGKASRRLSFPHKNERLQLRLEAESEAQFSSFQFLKRISIVCFALMGRRVGGSVPHIKTKGCSFVWKPSRRLSFQACSF